MNAFVVLSPQAAFHFWRWPPQSSGFGSEYQLGRNSTSTRIKVEPKIKSQSVSATLILLSTVWPVPYADSNWLGPKIRAAVYLGVPTELHTSFPSPVNLGLPPHAGEKEKKMRPRGDHTGFILRLKPQTSPLPTLNMWTRSGIWARLLSITCTLMVLLSIGSSTNGWWRPRWEVYGLWYNWKI